VRARDCCLQELRAVAIQHVEDRAIEDLMSALVKAGVSCQLKFLEGKGDRDKVVIYDEHQEKTCEDITPH
jgi:hypothetical protein